MNLLGDNIDTIYIKNIETLIHDGKEFGARHYSRDPY
jgi:hypothetical protein